MTMQELMIILKRVKTCDFMDLCANYLADIKAAQESGASHYEIRGIDTKSGNPHVIEFYENQ